MDTVVNFYNNLFVIEITIFGIIAATIFVFLQIVYGKFSYRETAVLFKNPYLIFYVLLSTFSILTTGIVSLLLSFSKHDFIPNINLNIQFLFMNEFFALELLLSFFASIVLFIFLIFTNIKYIRPPMIALLIGKNIKTKHIRNFILKKYGIPPPDNWLFVYAINYKNFHTENSLIKLPQKDNEKKYKTINGKEEEIEVKKREVEEKMESYQEKFKQVKTEIERSQNPFESLDGLFLKIIETSDLKTIDEACLVLTQISSRFIEAYPQTEEKNIWSPDIGIVENYLKNLMETLRMYAEMCDRQNLEIAKIKILETSRKIADILLVRNKSIEIKTVLVFWKELADRAIGQSPRIFGDVIQFYRDLADYAFDKGIEVNKEWIDEIFRHIGWLGERLLSKKGIEEKPIIHDDYYTTEYDQLFNVLFSYSYIYNNKYPESYPLIYFDAIHVIFLQLISRYKKNSIMEIKNNIFDCTYAYFSFAKEAILKSNNEGAALAIFNLKQCYDSLVEKELEESIKDIIGLLIEIGGYAAGNKDKLTKENFLSQPLDEYVMEIIENSQFQSTIKDEIHEVIIKVNGNRDDVWEFIKKLAKRMETNFGFTFDWQTGELYAQDDPRRN